MHGALAQYRRIAAEPLGVHALVQAERHALRFGAVERRLRSPFACAARDLSLPKPVKEMILALKPPGKWRASVESPAHRGAGIGQGDSA